MSNINIIPFNEGEHLLGSDFDLLPYEITHIFVEDEELLGVAFLDFLETEVYIANINAAIEGVGYGRKMVECLKSLEEITSITGVAGEVVLGFWEKLGAEFSNYCKTMEGYNFNIKC